MLRRIEWDSQHFNMNVGVCDVPIQQLNFDLESLEKEARLHHYDVVYVKSKNPVMELENRQTFRDERLVYVKDNTNRIASPFLQLQEENKHSFSIRSYKNQEITKDLIQLALASGEYSRYKLDERFNKACFERLYIDWISNSVHTDFATDVLVASVQGEDVGLLTYKVSDKVSIIGLLAVADTHRGLHIGKHLMNYYQALLPSQVTTLKVVTQGDNQIARRFYESCGYSIEDTSYTYHFWI